MESKKSEFFESEAAVAEYLGMGIVQFLCLRNCGKFPVSPRPRDPALVYWQSDIDEWVTQGKPCSNQRRVGGPGW